MRQFKNQLYFCKQEKILLLFCSIYFWVFVGMSILTYICVPQSFNLVLIWISQNIFKILHKLLEFRDSLPACFLTKSATSDLRPSKKKVYKAVVQPYPVFISICSQILTFTPYISLIINFFYFLNQVVFCFFFLGLTRRWTNGLISEGRTVLNSSVDFCLCLEGCVCGCVVVDVCVCVCVAQSRPTLCEPMDCSLPGSSYKQARI